MIENEPDWEFEPTEETSEEDASGSLIYEIMNYPADTTLSGYVDMWARNELVIPKFQRGFIWDQVKASKLIESFLLGLPVPGVFLFKEQGNANYLVIDGQQRIRSIVSFLKGVIHDRAFRLKNVDPKWDGKRFEDLTDDEQFRLKGCVLRSTIIQQINPADKSSIYLIFERLNTGGVNLNPMEIRQCVSYGPFVKVLKKMNEDEHWKLIIGKKEDDKRLRDVELILRCLALFKHSDEYEKPMKRFLNDFMVRQIAEPDDYEDLQQRFATACANIHEQLGEKPFNLRGRLNYGLLDSVLTTELISGPIEDLKPRLDLLLANEDYVKAITINTSDTIEVQTRLRLAGEILLS